MNKFSLDLSKFKRIRSDEHTSTLQHKDGHELKIAHKSLSPKLKDQLSQLPMAPQRMKDGGMAEKVDELRAQDKDPAYMQAQAEKLGLTDDSAPAQSDTGSTPVPAEYTPGVSNPGPVAQIGNNPSAPQPGDAGEQGAAPDSPAPMQAQAAPTAPAAPSQKVKSMQDMQNEFAHIHQNAVQQLSMDDRQAANELGKIDPKTYGELLGDQSTPGKILSLFGLMMGGMGAGLTHTENPVTQMWDKIISNDIDKQKTNINNKLSFRKLADEEALNGEHVISAHLQNEANLDDLTRKRTNMRVMNEINAEISKYPPGSPKAIAAQKQMALLQPYVNLENANINNVMAARSAFQQQMNGAGGDDEDSFKNRMQFLRMNGQEQYAKDAEAKHLPGIPGQASMEISPETRKEYLHLNNLGGVFAQAQDYLNSASKFGSGFQNANRARGKALSNSIELEIGQLEGLGRFTPEEAKRYRDMVPDLAGTHFTNQDQAKLTQLMTELNNHKNNLVQSVGLKPAQSASAPAQEIKTVNGIKWARGPNNKAIQVQ